MFCINPNSIWKQINPENMKEKYEAKYKTLWKSRIFSISTGAGYVPINSSIPEVDFMIHKQKDDWGADFIPGWNQPNKYIHVLEGRDLPVIFQTFSTLLAKQESKVSLPEFKKGKDLLCLADEKVLPNILWQVPLLQKEQVISRGIFWVLPWTCMPVVKHEHRLL